MSFFLKCVGNVFNKINSDIDIDSDQSTSYLMRNSFDYNDSEIYMQMILKFIDNFYIIKNIKSMMAQFLIPLKCPMNVDFYIQFREIMKINCSESNITDITDSFLSLIFCGDFTVNFELDYQKDLFLFCLEYAEKYLRKLNEFDHLTDNKVKTENELILHGFSLFYLFVFLVNSENDSITIEDDVLVNEMAENIGYDWNFDELIANHGKDKLEILKHFVCEKITGLPY